MIKYNNPSCLHVVITYRHWETLYFGEFPFFSIETNHGFTLFSPASSHVLLGDKQIPFIHDMMLNSLLLDIPSIVKWVTLSLVKLSLLFPLFVCSFSLLFPLCIFHSLHSEQSCTLFLIHSSYSLPLTSSDCKLSNAWFLYTQYWNSMTLSAQTHMPVQPHTFPVHTQIWSDSIPWCLFAQLQWCLYNCIFFSETQQQQGGESMSFSASTFICFIWFSEWQIICKPVFVC